MCGAGGFALVFVVRSVRSYERFALKRLCVNNQQDLAVAQREIDITVSFLFFIRLYLYILVARGQVLGKLFTPIVPLFIKQR